MKYSKNEKIRETENWIASHDSEYKCMLLSRMEQDCRYFLGYGERYEGHLWALRVEDQIHYMRFTLNSLGNDEKPEWLTVEQIDHYEKEMLAGERRRDKFYYNRGTEACFNDCFSSFGYMKIDGLKKIKAQKETYKKELGRQYDLYDPGNQFKEGYIAEAERLIGVHKEYYKDCEA